MSPETAIAAVDRMFETPSPNLTVEFQGGEPLLNFPRVRQIVDLIEHRNCSEHRSIVFTISSTLHHLTDEILSFFREHDFQVSTSLDGPAWLHDANRPTPTKDAHARTISGIEWARKVLGADKVSALTTLTRRSLKHPEAIIDEYVRLRFPSIFLRPLSPFGFAVKAERKIGYGMGDFVHFYDRALSHILKLNRGGVALEEAYASILLTHILTPFSSRYVDLRSPTGAGFGTLVYNYNGSVYPSDESRMLAEMGDDTFLLGNVHQSYPGLMASPAMGILRRSGVAEDLPGCADCAFVPFCGADPVHMHATQGSAIGNPLASAHHQRHMGLFQILFRYLENADPEVMRVFVGWVTHNPPRAKDLAEVA
jgi:His-Xaa-Ser system radical SAM maturase HxsB